MAYRLGSAIAHDEALLAWAKDPDDARLKDLAGHVDGWTPPQFPLKGRDALALGMASGAEVGNLLQAIEEEWIAGDFKGDRAALLEELERRIAAI